MLALLPLLATAALVADAPNNCDNCAAMNTAREPFQVHGNTWFVGTQGLASILITSDRGHILIDGGLTQSAPLIAANIEKLGFALSDVKLILNSHTHSDHAGGIAALQRVSRGRVAASPAAKRALEGGGATEDDPQFAFGAEHNSFPAVQGVRAVKDGEHLRVGKLQITAHFTPGHTPGGTTWTWISCERGDCASIVYADSLSSISAPGFRFTGDATHPARVEQFEKSIARIAGLDCGILLAPHPELVRLDAKLAARAKDPTQPAFRNPNECKTYADGARTRLAKRVAEERAAEQATSSPSVAPRP